MALKELEKELGGQQTVFPESRPIVSTLVLMAGVAGYAWINWRRRQQWAQ